MPVSANFYEDNENGTVDLEGCLKEIKILMTLSNHPHVVSLFGVVVDAYLPMGVVVEYCNEGTVFNGGTP